MIDEEPFNCFSVPSSCITIITKLKSPSYQKMCKLSATFLMNQEDCKQMEIHRSGWFIVEMSTRKKNRELKLIKLVHILRFSEIKCNEVLMSDEMLFNVMNTLGSNDGKFKSSVALNIKSITNLNTDFIPKVANKVTLCIIAHDTILERQLLDYSLMSYFQTPCYVCKGDVVAINITKYIPEILLDFSKQNISFIYFKVVEIEGPSYNINSLQKVDCGYIIDNNTALYQVSSEQGYVPHYKYHSIPKITSVEICNIKHVYPPLIPSYFTPKFDVLLSWFQQFTKKECQGKYS